jgi:hypothetical protein
MSYGLGGIRGTTSTIANRPQKENDAKVSLDIDIGYKRLLSEMLAQQSQHVAYARQTHTKQTDDAGRSSGPEEP